LGIFPRQTSRNVQGFIRTEPSVNFFRASLENKKRVEVI